MIDLQRPRDAGELLTAALSTFGRRWRVFLSMTFVVVAPLVVLLDGVWGGVFADGPRADRPLAQWVVGQLLLSTVVPAVVTGLHCVVVAALGEGRMLSVTEAFRDLAPRLPRALGAVLLYAAAVFAGLVALVIPGIWISVRWYFAAQAAVLEERPPRAAVARSAELVGDSWWRVLGLLALIGILTGLFVAPITTLALEGSSGVLWVTAAVVGRTLALSLSAIFGTLLFFDLRARSAAPAPAPPTWTPPGSSGRPGDGAPPGWAPPRPPPG